MSLSDVSDLTELSSDEDDFSPPKTTRTTTASKKKTKEYKITGALRPPRTTSYTAKSLYDQIIENAIDLDPEYQRDIVWAEAKQSGLIDSMLRNYYIPPIIFAVSIADDGSELRTCIDGKQRLTSIQRFVDGQIPHKDSFTNEKLWYKSSATNARRKLLSKQLINQFGNKQIVCIEYTDLSGDQEREIFQRVQLGVALTPAERMQAIVGPWPTVIREIQSQVLGEDGFQGYLDWGHARGRDFQCLASIGYLIENHPKPTVPAAPTLEKWLLKNEPVSPKLREDLLDTFRVFLVLARDQKYSDSLNNPTRVSPIEFVMIGVLIYLFRERLSLTQLSSAIEKMRKDVRDAHRDIRANGRVTKHMLLFMSKRLKISELRSDGKGDKPAAGKATKSKKRKRPAEYDDDSDEEEKGHKLPRKGTVPEARPVTSSTSKSGSKALAHSKSDPVPTKLPAAGSKQGKALLDSQPFVQKEAKVPVTTKASAPTPVPPVQLARPSPSSIQSPSLQPNIAVSQASVERTSKVPVTARASVPTPTPAQLARLSPPIQSPSLQSNMVTQQLSVERTSKVPAVTVRASVPTHAPPVQLARSSQPSMQSASLQSNTVISARPSPAPITNAMSEAHLSPMKSEPHVASLYSSTAIPSSSVLAPDRLGPIRVAKEVIRSNSGSHVQSPVIPYAEHQAGGSAPNLDVNSPSATRDPWRSGPSSLTVPPQPNPTPLPNSTGQQINPSDVEALLRVHGLMPQIQHMPIASHAVLPGQNVASVQLGLNWVGTSAPGPVALSPSQPMQHGTLANGTGLTVQSVPTPQYLSQAPLHLPDPQTGLSNGTHPALRHSIPDRPPLATPTPIGTAPRADSTANQPPPYSASSTRSFQDERRYNDYERRGYEKDYRRHDSGDRRASSGYNSRRGRDSRWDQRGSSWRKV